MLGVVVFKLFYYAKGVSLVETMVCLAILAVLTSLALPLWRPWVARSEIEITRDTLINDIQTARVQALQLGTRLQMLRLGGCSWGTTDSSDWSCGWQLQRQDTQEVLRIHAIQTPLLMWMAEKKELTISARGFLGNVGARWHLRTSHASVNTQFVVCLNSANRLRWQTGSACMT